MKKAYIIYIAGNEFLGEYSPSHYGGRTHFSKWSIPVVDGEFSSPSLLEDSIQFGELPPRIKKYYFENFGGDEDSKFAAYPLPASIAGRKVVDQICSPF